MVRVLCGWVDVDGEVRGLTVEVLGVRGFR